MSLRAPSKQQLGSSGGTRCASNTCTVRGPLQPTRAISRRRGPPQRISSERSMDCLISPPLRADVARLESGFRSTRGSVRLSLPDTQSEISVDALLWTTYADIRHCSPAWYESLAPLLVPGTRSVSRVDALLPTYRSADAAATRPRSLAPSSCVGSSKSSSLAWPTSARRSSPRGLAGTIGTGDEPVLAPLHVPIDALQQSNAVHTGYDDAHRRQLGELALVRSRVDDTLTFDEKTPKRAHQVVPGTQQHWDRQLSAQITDQRHRLDQPIVIALSVDRL